MRRQTAFALVLVILAACGGNFTKRADKTLSTSLVATNAARDAFVSWDEKHQLEIVDRAASRETAEAQLKTYRQKRQDVVKAFAIAYAAIAAAAAAVPLVEKGKTSEGDLLMLLADTLKAANAAKTALDAIQGEQ